MKIICDAKRLKLGCEIAKSIGLKSSLPAISLLLIEAKEGKAILKATNLEQCVLFDLKAEVEEDGQCFVNPNSALRFVRQEKRNIRLNTIDKNDVELSNIGGEGSIKTRLVNIGELEPVPCPKMTDLPLIRQVLTHKAKLFSYALQCVALEPSRPVLSGVLFDFTKESLTLVSADGFRLMRIKIPMAENDTPAQVVIPANAIKLVAKYMTGSIAFASDKNKAWFETDDLTLISQTIQGTYPAYSSLMPTQEPNWTISVSAPIVSQRLKQMGSGGTKIVRLTQKDNLLSLVEKYEDVEDTEALIPAVFEGEGKIAVNPEYLLPVSAIFSEMKIEITSPSSPLKITGDLDGVTVLIMPMFVQW